MPIYEYVCTSCEKRFELKQSLTDPTLQTCDQLGCAEAKPVNKVISAPAIMFKGSGWYVTDYSEKLKEPGAQSDNDKEKKTDVKSTSSQADSKETSESKPKGDTSSNKSTPDSSSSSSGPNSSSSPGSSSSSTSSGSSSSDSSKSSSSNS